MSETLLAEAPAARAEKLDAGFRALDLANRLRLLRDSIEGRIVFTRIRSSPTYSSVSASTSKS